MQLYEYISQIFACTHIRFFLHLFSQIAEQRRVRIQDLEQQMSNLRKKVLEQQRAIKLNEKNESKVKLLAEEIRLMKSAKVKLIRQMKEDADRVRVWKTQKEKEVATLKQTERKQQVRINRFFID